MPTNQIIQTISTYSLITKTGGIILSDNVLWSGKVVEPIAPNDIDTRALLAYNKLVNSNDQIETLILPIRDGLTISRKKEMIL